MKNFSFQASVFRWPGDAGWHFVYLPKDLAKKIKEKAKTYGGGFVKIEAKIGKTKWNTSLFPYKREDTYLICIKKQVREKEDIFVGETLKVSFQLI